jgi:hypothetical protein
MRKAYLLCFIVIAVAFTACKKENEAASVLKTYSDSMALLNFTYKDKKVDAVFTSTSNKYVSFVHGENYIKAIGKGIEVEYFLNSFKLPVRIVYFYGVPGKYEVNYYYKQGTNILDSVVNTSGSNGTIREKYSFEYNGENIEKVIIHSSYSFTTAISESFLSYTYSSAPNIFRNSDPLLFIYTNPLAELNYHSLLFYFPKIFSGSTFATCSYPYNTTIKIGKLNYSTNGAGKIVKEWYVGFGHPHEYFYSH